MSIDRIDRRRVAWCLVIDGCAYRYYSGVAPGNDLTAGRLTDSGDVVVRSPVDVDGLVSVSDYGASIDDRAGIASEDPMTVSIVARGARLATGGRIDPVHTLMRVAGPQASDYRVRLTSTLAHAVAGDGPVSIEVDEDVSGWPWPMAVHLGLETIWVDDGQTVLGDYMLTDCTRAADGWAAQAHYVDDAAGERPYITSDIVTWRGRRARVFCGAILSTGAVESWSEVYAGVIDAPPSHSGDVVTLRIMPLTAVMRYRLGVGSAARTTQSVAGAHRFVRGEADVLHLVADWEFGDLPILFPDAADPVTGELTFGSDDSHVWLEQMGGAEGLYIGWPERFVDAEPVESVAGGVLTFATPSPLVQAVSDAIAADDDIALRIEGRYREHLPLTLTDPDDADPQDVAWPQRLIDVVNAGTVTQLGAVDSWSDPSADGHQERIIRASLRIDDSPSLLAWVADVGSRGPSPVGRIRLGIGGRVAWCALLTTDVDVREVRERGYVTHPRRVPGSWVTLDGDVTHREERRQDPHAFALPPQATWFYRSGEQWIGPFAGNVYTGAVGVEQLMRVTTAGPARHVWVDSVDTSTHPTTGETVYYYQVVERHRDTTHSIMVLDGEDAADAMMVASASDSDPGAYILSLLVSGVGDGDHGDEDTMPIGANVPPAGVIARHFRRLAAPVSLQRQDYEAVRGKTIAEQVEGLLIACGAQVASIAAGIAGLRLGLVPLGPPSSSESVASLTDADLIPIGSSPVVTSVDGRTVRSVVVRMQATRGEDPVEIPVSLGVETTAAGGDSGQALTIDIPGVVISDPGGRAQAAAEVVADIRSRVGVPRLRWTVRVRGDSAGMMSVGLGSVVTLTSEHAYGIVPTETADAAVCRVVGFRRDVQANTIDLDLRPYPAFTGGWGPALVVTQVDSPTKVRVDADTYSAADISHFAAGDAVYCVPAGDWAGRTVTTIASIGSEPSVTTDDPHGLAVGDTIRLADYTSATGARLATAGYAWLSSAAGTVDGDPGQVIA